ncbi:hypothetical protein OIU85_026545 [Salix viminalis]|uniref:RING-type E3 ubiquitin transferase n=1 Tax=Salix viminalis TaxID=40686 RepID=A0A9Q0TNQ9_SALVM|nr:hypothetical protein OIU85_026545 [Salix viminalis]
MLFLSGKAHLQKAGKTVDYQISPSPTLSPATSTLPCHDQSQEPAIDFNVMVIVAAMMCALVCALGLNSMLQCVFQCTRRAVTEPAAWISSRRQNSGLKKREMVALPTSTYAHQGLTVVSFRLCHLPSRLHRR